MRPDTPDLRPGRGMHDTYLANARTHPQKSGDGSRNSQQGFLAWRNACRQGCLGHALFEFIDPPGQSSNLGTHLRDQRWQIVFGVFVCHDVHPRAAPGRVFYAASGLA